MAEILKIDWNKWRTVVEAYQKVLEWTALEVAGQFKFEAPVDTGRLSGSFGSRRTGEFSWQAGTNVVYSIPVIGGHVRHTGSSGKPPIGTLGNPYHERAMENVRKVIPNIVFAARQRYGLI